jgi:hypothetical protein
MKRACLQRKEFSSAKRMKHKKQLSEKEIEGDMGMGCLLTIVVLLWPYYSYLPCHPMLLTSETV